MSSLTPSQKKIVFTLASLIQKTGFSPTIREIADEMGIKPPSVYEQLRKLEKKGYITKSKNKARTIELLKIPENLSFNEISDEHKVKIPILARISPTSVFSSENYSGYLEINKSVITKDGNFFALKVKDNSMIEAGIKPEHYIIIRQQTIVLPGGIAAVILGNEITVKRISKINDRFYLIPENPNYNSIDITTREDFKMLGQVITWI